METDWYKNMEQWTSPNSAGQASNLFDIPKEWQKANEALKEVRQTKTEALDQSPKAAPKQAPQPGIVNYPYQFWSHPWPFAGYTNIAYPGYNYYNMNMQQYNGAQFSNFYNMPPMPVSNNVLPQQQQQVSSTTTSNSLVDPVSSSSKDETNANVANDTITSQPSISSPSTSSSSQTSQENSRPKQAPGSGGIRFSLPKNKVKVNNFTLNYQSASAKIDNNPGTQNYDSHFAGPSQTKDNFQLIKGESHFTLEKDKKCKKLDFKNGNWPPSLKTYVNNAFKCKLEDKDKVEVALRQKLTKALTNHSLWNTDWSAEPLPTAENNKEFKVKELEFIPLEIGIHKKFKPNKELKEISHSKLTSKISIRSKSGSRSRSRSYSPHSRRVVHRRQHSSSSNSSSSSDNNRYIKKKSFNPSPRIMNSEIRNKFSNRLGKKNKKKKKNKLQSAFTIDGELGSEDRLQKRAARFETVEKKGSPSLALNVNSASTVNDPSEIDWSSYAIVGTSQDIEKSFLRITSAVDPSTIRPPEVLVQSLKNVKDRWIAKQDYHYACEQLKSIRQDLTVQCVRNEFTIEAYETHARIALEKGDHTEFAQCQSQLRALYKELNIGNQLEFTGYFILYCIYTNNTRDIKNILATLSSEEKADGVISHALALNRAWTLNNYHSFFNLYKTAPKMSGFMMDWFLNRERLQALKIIVKAYVMLF